MRFSEDRLPPLWVERFDTYYGADLTPHDLYLEELDERPSRFTASRRVPAATGTPGADRTVTPSLTASGGTRLPAPGPNSSEGLS